MTQVSLLQAPPQEHRLQAWQVPDTIYFVGDSITLGWRDEEAAGWPARLMRRLHRRGHAITGYNLGIRGDTSREIADRWQAEVQRRQRGPNALIVFAFGVNDAKIEPDGRRSMPAEETDANLRRILRSAREHAVLLIGPGPVDETTMHRHLNADGQSAMPSPASISEIAQAMSEAAAAVAVPYLDLLGTLSASETWRRSLAETDGLHPSRIGHDLIADEIERWPAWSGLFSEAGESIG